jgi:hypothetical protein
MARERWWHGLTLLIVAGLVVLAAGCASNGYWYCWDTGDPAPHHLGHPVAGDHLCSSAGLAASQSTTSSQSSAAPPATAPPLFNDTPPPPPRQRHHRSHLPVVPQTTTSTSTTSSAVPTQPAAPSMPDSRPMLTGATSATSGGFSVTITALTPEHDLDVPAYSGEPSFGVGIRATCSEPDARVITWSLSTDGASSPAGVATCINGTFGGGFAPTSFSVDGCGGHELAVTPMGLGPLSDPRERPAARAMRFAFKVC